MDKEFQRSFVNYATFIISAIAAILFLAGTLFSQSPSPTPSSDAVQSLRAIEFGETVNRTGSPKEVHGYQLKMDAGTSVKCNVGERDLPSRMSLVIPDKVYPAPSDKVPDSVEVGRIHPSIGGVVEPFVIVADRAGSYVIKFTFFPSWASGSYSFRCGVPHATTDRDRKYAAAEKLFTEIRQAVDAGNKEWSVRDKIGERLAIYRSLDDKVGVALSIGGVAGAYLSNGDYRTSLSVFREEVKMFEALNSPNDVFRLLATVGNVCEVTGDVQCAIDTRIQRLSVSRAIGSKSLEADALFGLGIVYHRLTDESKAREYYEQSVSIRRAVDPPTFDSLNAQVLFFTNMANLVRGMNGGEIPVDGFGPRTEDDYRQALVYLQQSLEINRKMEMLLGRSADWYRFNLLQMANTYRELGQYAEALSYLARFADHPSSQSKTERARVDILFGSVYARKGEMDKAAGYFNEVISLLRDGANPGNQIGYLHNIANDYYYAGDLQRSLDAQGEALELGRSRSTPMYVANSLFGIARIERDLGNFDIARKNVEEAMQIAEELRGKITADELRTTYFSTVKRFYEFYIELLMQAHKAQPEKAFDRLALETSEKARSRNLLDLLTISGVDIKKGVDPLLVDRERTLQQQLSRKATQQTRLLMAKHTDADAAKIKQEVSDLSSQYAAIQSEIRERSPGYAALTQPTSLNTNQIQQLLDSGTVLLEYSLGEKKSYLWVVSSNSLASYDIPGRDQIEAGARKVYRLLAERNRRVKDETDDQRRSRIKLADAEYPNVASDLAEMLLGPAALQIRNKRLLIVPDGALNYVSFAALPSPKGEEASGTGLIALGVNHEIVTLPSASTLSRLREETATREPAPKMLAVFADPVFDEVDARAAVAGKRPFKTLMTNAKTGGSSGSRDFERAVSDVGIAAVETGGLRRLPFSRREADAIFSVSPKNLSLKRTDFEASKQEVFKSGLDQYRILHFATHGLIDSQHPELSGVVLSLVNKDRSEIDGFLRLQDIYNLKLNADLVVLSACNTALGKEVKGEGLIGLTRGFMYAGAPRVVASLWKVDDAATAELMAIFYRKMLVENLRPAAALRAAQTEMMKQSRWRSPYYWAPFVLQGEWK